MEMQKLSQEVKKIKMPEEMKERILNNCYNSVEEKEMSKNKEKKIFTKPMAAVASMAVCFGLLGVTAMAATGKLQGFFKDITRWDGAVTGTVYEQATDEINLSVMSASDELTIIAEMVNPDAVPYKEIETFGIKTYEIVDVNGEVVVEDGAAEFTEIADGKATFAILLSDLPAGEYKLIISEFVGGAKADQPLVISGTWECEFTR